MFVFLFQFRYIRNVYGKSAKKLPLSRDLRVQIFLYPLCTYKKGSYLII